MREDSIIKQVRRAKEEIAAKYGNDVRALGKAIQEEQRRSGRTVVSRSAKRVDVK